MASTATRVLREFEESPRTFKSVLQSPYNLKWPPILADKRSKIMHELLTSMVGVARPKQERRSSSAGEPSAKRLRCAPDDEFDAAKRACLVVGLRSTVRSLERGVLCAGVVCLSTCPVLLQQHLLTLVAVRGVPFIALHDLSPTLASLMGVSSVAALGFTAAAPAHFSQLLEVMKREAPAVHLPWLCASPRRGPADKDTARSMQEGGRGSTPSSSGGRGSTPSSSGGRGVGFASSHGGGPSHAAYSVRGPVYCEASISKVSTTPNSRKVKKRKQK